ncbi:hypothetical protein WG954_14915 [Lacibacter sp. H375]|uniref:hypothetical protein n=1 Tax=Lacibacter sp. H375 TaxID=3133424 RepID=UPI0030C11E5E
MYSIIMVFLIVVGSFTGIIILPAAVTNKLVGKQQLKAIQVADAPAALPKRGVYTVSTEEYYLIH